MSELNKFTMSGDLVLKAKADFKNIESAIAGLSGKLKGLSFDNKTTRALETSFGRIAGLVPDLQRKLERGLFNDGDVRDYLSNVRLLTNELDKITRQYLGVREHNMLFDNDELQQYARTIDEVQRKLKGMEKGPTFDTVGIPLGKGVIADLLKNLAEGIKRGQTLAETLTEVRRV